MTGIWHGARWTFIIWGLNYFIIIAFEKITGWPEKLSNKPFKIVYRIISLLIINFQWVIFRSANLHQGFTFIKTMCTNISISSSSSRAWFLLKDYGVFIFLAFLLATPIVPKLESLSYRKANTAMLYHIGYFLIVVGAFIISLSFVVSVQNSPFLYANF